MNGWATGLVVCPLVNLLDVLKEVEAGRLGLDETVLGLTVAAGCCGFGLQGGSGLNPAGQVDCGRGFGWGFGATMGLIVAFLSTAKGFGVSRGLGPGAGLLGSGVMIWDWAMEGISTRLLLASVRGLR